MFYCVFIASGHESVQGLEGYIPVKSFVAVEEGQICGALPWNRITEHFLMTGPFLKFSEAVSSGSSKAKSILF